jgi:hypothetical protein
VLKAYFIAGFGGGFVLQIIIYVPCGKKFRGKKNRIHKKSPLYVYVSNIFFSAPKKYILPKIWQRSFKLD